MHERAYEHGRLFFENYWRDGFEDVVELGSLNINGSLRDHAPPGARYIGLDWAEGPGVDRVVAAGSALPLEDGCADVVLSSSALEHDPCFWETFVELARLLKPGGVLYLNVPSNNWFHRHPMDCWRFYPDAGHALAQWANRCGRPLTLVESFVARPGASGWADCVAVFHRPGVDLRRRASLASRTDCHNVWDYEAPSLARREDASFDQQRVAELQQQCKQLARRAAAAEAELAAAYAALELLKT